MNTTKKWILICGSVLSVWLAVVIGYAFLCTYLENHYPPDQRFVQLPCRFTPVLFFTMIFLGPLAFITSSAGIYLSLRFSTRRLIFVGVAIVNAVGVLAAIGDILWLAIIITHPFPVH